MTEIMVPRGFLPFLDLPHFQAALQPSPPIASSDMARREPALYIDRVPIVHQMRMDQAVAMERAGRATFSAPPRPASR
jgi:hypothetical protein